MRKIIEKENEIQESVIVLHYTLCALYEKYNFSIPENICKQIQDLVNSLESLMGYDKSLSDDYDILDTKYILKVKYGECDYLKKNKKSN